jgi:hypothetical protein
MGRADVGRGRKALIALLVVFVVLFGLVIVADRVLAGIAEDKIAEQAAAEMRKAGATSDGDPSVKIDGFPFLTQVAGGNYEKITITAKDARNDDIQLETMTIVATDVKAAAGDLMNGRGPVTADRLTGTATMTWDTVRSLIELSGLSVPFDPSELQITVADNKVELRLPIELAGFSTVLKATGEVTVAQGKVQLKLTDIGTENAELPAPARALLNQYRNRLTATIRTPQMPYSLVINKVETGPNGVLVIATASGVQLAT